MVTLSFQLFAEFLDVGGRGARPASGSSDDERQRQEREKMDGAHGVGGKIGKARFADQMVRGLQNGQPLGVVGKLERAVGLRRLDIQHLQREDTGSDSDA